jgi:ketosteroid isomerase-like protein
LLAKALADGYEAYNRRDWEALLAMFHPEFERHSTGTPGLVATMDFEMHSRGHQGYLHFMQRWFESYGEIRIEPREVIDFGDRVLVLVDRKATGRASGVGIDLDAADIVTLRDGWVVRYDDYWAKEDALAAVGLPETGALVPG